MSARALYDALIEGDFDTIPEIVEAMEYEDVIWHVSEVIGVDDYEGHGHEIYIQDNVSEDVLWVNTSMDVFRYYEIAGKEYCVGVAMRDGLNKLVGAVFKYIRHEDEFFEGVE